MLCECWMYVACCYKLHWLYLFVQSEPLNHNCWILKYNYYYIACVYLVYFCVTCSVFTVYFSIIGSMYDEWCQLNTKVWTGGNTDIDMKICHKLTLGFCIELVSAVSFPTIFALKTLLCQNDKGKGKHVIPHDWCRASLESTLTNLSPCLYL